MKIHITCLLLLLSLNLSAQKIQSISRVGYFSSVNTYLGNIEGKEYFYNKWLFYVSNAPVLIGSRSGDSIVKEGELLRKPSERIFEVFAFENLIYTIVGEYRGGNINVRLDEYNAKLKVIDSRDLFETPRMKSEAPVLHMKLEGEMLMVLLMKKEAEGQFISAICNMKKDDVFVNVLTCPDIENYNCADMIVNENFQAGIVLENRKHKEKAFLVCCDRTEVVFREIHDGKEDMWCGSFKLTFNSDNTFSAGSLVYKIKGKKATGYALCKTSFDDEGTLMMELFESPDLVDLDKSGHYSNTKMLRLKVFEPVSNDRYLFISENNYVMQPNNVVPKLETGFSPPGFTYYLLTSMVVSSLNMKSKSIEWVVPVKGRFEILYTARAASPGFVYNASENECTIYCNLPIVKYHRQGKYDNMETSPEHKCTPSVIKINLQDGNCMISPISKTLNDLPYEWMLPESFYEGPEGEKYFMTMLGPIQLVHNRMYFLKIPE